VNHFDEFRDYMSCFSLSIHLTAIQAESTAADILVGPGHGKSANIHSLADMSRKSRDADESSSDKQFDMF
jgi:hypothetical protein